MLHPGAAPSFSISASPGSGAETRPAAVEAWRATRSRAPDTAFAVRAGDLLFRGAPPGLPTFVPGFRGRAEVQGHGGAGAVRRTPEDGAAGRSPAKLLYGVALQRVERPVSARREFSAAAKLAPNDADALVADAIGRFDKEHPERAFSRMGPLTRRFPGPAASASTSA